MRADLHPLDGPGAMQAALGGSTLWAVRKTPDGRPHTLQVPSPAMLGALGQPLPPASLPFIAAEHRCTKRGTEAARAADRVAWADRSKETDPTAPKARVAPSGTASSASQAELSPASPAEHAATRVSDSGRTHHSGKSERIHPCHSCGRAVNLDSAAAYVAELGATVMFAAHTDC